MQYSRARCLIALSLCASSACGPGGERTDSSPNDSDAIADRAQPATDVASSDGATNAPMDGSMPTLDAGEDAALDVALEGAYDAANDGSADSATPARDTVELIAGSTATGFADGVGAAARFSGPSGAVLSADGATMYVADTFNALLRTIDVATGATRTVAGRLQVQSVVDGVGAAARFQSPRAMAITNDGATLYVADGPTVRRVDTRSWSVTTIAGTAGMSGYVDGAGATVRLGFLLHSFALSDDERTLYIADRSNRVLRALDVSAAPMTGEVRTVAGTRYTGADVHADGVGAAARFSGLGAMPLS